MLPRRGTVVTDAIVERIRDEDTVTRSLLDINVPVAMVDPDHRDHERVHQWAQVELADGWASCALTQNGFVRVLSQPAYPGHIPVGQAVALLRQMHEHGNHAFWPCAASMLDILDATHLVGHRQITDAYLLGLAVRNGGRFVTLDRGVPLRAVPGATAAHLVVLGTSDPPRRSED